MKQVDLDSTLKIGKESKDQQEQKKKTSKNESWKPIARDLAFAVAKGLITGFTLRLGGKMYDYSFDRKTSNTSLSIIAGGKGSNSLAI